MRSRIIRQTLSVISFIVWIIGLIIWWNTIISLTYLIVGTAWFILDIYAYNKLYCKALKYLDPYIPYKKWYEQNEFLHEYEIKFYKTLYKVIHKEYWDRYHIFSQVNMQELFQKKKPQAFWLNMALDFLIVDYENDLNPVLAIELNWDNHYTDPVQGARDLKKKNIFSISKIPLVYIKNKDAENEQIVYDKILPKLEAKRMENKN